MMFRNKKPEDDFVKPKVKEEPAEKPTETPKRSVYRYAQTYVMRGLKEKIEEYVSKRIEQEYGAYIDEEVKKFFDNPDHKEIVDTFIKNTMNVYLNMMKDEK